MNGVVIKFPAAKPDQPCGPEIPWVGKVLRQAGDVA
jgi:hypothetical protein